MRKDEEIPTMGIDKFMKKFPTPESAYKKHYRKVRFRDDDMVEGHSEIGFIYENDPDYIHFLDEPCKININKVTILKYYN